MKKLILTGLMVAAFMTSSQGQTTKLDQKQKEATSHTKKTNNDLLNYLPFGDKTDFDNARKGFIATIEAGEIKDEKGNVVYSMKQYDFIKGNAPATTNPSLWRQSELNSINGLFKVTDGVYQIRGFDLANMSLIEGNSGWIIVDPLLSP
ncbi:hypothetical protein [Chryseobacterium indoltheticum]|uniref:hypothetical protein n=1 Tax=Chryseobacterium indoltheticum TaxID=254 RepID=UPI003F4994E5